jgi:hypothetical protein
MGYNGPAIWGGCVPAFSLKKRDGALFAVQVPSYAAYTCFAVQGCQSVSQLSRCSQAYFGQWRGPGLSGGTILSWEQESKKCNKQLTHIVRVSLCSYFLS